MLPRGAGNFRWIILGPGKPVLNRAYCLNPATLSNRCCELIGCACMYPLGKWLCGMFSIPSSVFQLTCTYLFLRKRNTNMTCIFHLLYYFHAKRLQIHDVLVTSWELWILLFVGDIFGMNALSVQSSWLIFFSASVDVLWTTDGM